jgi:hypothetical protein
LSASTFGAGLVVGARIGIPAVVGGLIGWALQPFFVSIGWLEPGDPPRKIMFLIALGTIMGAAIVDLALVLRQALLAARSSAPVAEAPDWRRVDRRRCAVGGRVGRGHRGHRPPGAAAAGAVPARRGRAGVPVRHGQRHLGGERLQPDLVGLRGVGGRDGGPGPGRSRASA